MSSISVDFTDFLSKPFQNYSKSVGSSRFTLRTKVFHYCEFCKQNSLHTLICCNHFTKPVHRFSVNIEQIGSKPNNRDQGLEKVLFNKELSDFSIQIDDEQVPVSKAVLAAHSPVFHRMFTAEFKEKNVQSLEIKNWSSEAFKEMIRFIYTGRFKDLAANVIDLMDLQDYYQVDRLKEVSEKTLLKVINGDNANLIFQKAHFFGYSMDLKRAAFNKIKEVLKTQNYELLDCLMDEPQKVNTICTFIMNLDDALQN